MSAKLRKRKKRADKRKGEGGRAGDKRNRQAFRQRKRNALGDKEKAEVSVIPRARFPWTWL
jgi:hypothetical protein